MPLCCLCYEFEAKSWVINLIRSHLIRLWIAASVNLALHKSLLVSANSNDPQSITSTFGTALDGLINLETEWVYCAQTGDSMTGPKWMLVDLGQVYSIGYVIVTNTADGNFNNTTYRLVN